MQTTDPDTYSYTTDTDTDPDTDTDTGTDTDTDTGTIPPPTATGAERRRPVWWAVMVVGLALLIGLTLWGARLRAEDAAANRRLDAGRAAVRHTLAVLRSTEAHLVSEDGARTRATATLDLETTLLRGTEADLTREQSTITAQGVDITELSSCLAGVQVALNAVSLGDDARAIASLQAAGPACLAARPAS